MRPVSSHLISADLSRFNFCLVGASFAGNSSVAICILEKCELQLENVINQFVVFVTNRQCCDRSTVDQIPGNNEFDECDTSANIGDDSSMRHQAEPGWSLYRGVVKQRLKLSFQLTSALQATIYRGVLKYEAVNVKISDS